MAWRLGGWTALILMVLCSFICVPAIEDAAWPQFHSTFGQSAFLSISLWLQSSAPLMFVPLTLALLFATIGLFRENLGRIGKLSLFAYFAFLAFTILLEPVALIHLCAHGGIRTSPVSEVYFSYADFAVALIDSIVLLTLGIFPFLMMWAQAFYRKLRKGSRANSGFEITPDKS